jgi:hypothetical protein
MKKIFIFSLITLFFICCNGDNENIKSKLNITDENLVKANSLIEGFLSDTLIANINNKEIRVIDSLFEITNKDSIVKILYQYDSLRKAFDKLFKVVKNKNYINKGDEVNYHNDTLILYNYLESMKNQQQIIAGLYVNAEEKFIGWRIRYKYDVEGVGKIGKRLVWDTFVLNPDFTKVINYTSNDWDQDTNLRVRINNLKKYMLNRELNYVRFQQGLPTD